MSVRLRATSKNDLAFVLAAEQAGYPFVSQWTLEEHQAALIDSDISHLIVKNGQSVGS